jgi:hemerythrin-like domain-containing protein
MKSVEIIHGEHRLVQVMLRCLGALAEETRVLDRLDRRAATAVLSLLERFVDWSHQDKEELHLFPHMLARATPEEAVRLERLFDEHAQERRRLIGMWLNLEGACNGEPVRVNRFVTNALMYSRLQHKHVREEEGYLLPLAESILTPEDDQRILRGYRQIDERLGGLRGVRRKLRALCRRFCIEVEPEETPRGVLVPA